MNIAAIIPARYASTRFPGKPLVNINGKSMIHNVYIQASKVFDCVYVATDDNRIAKEIESFNGKYVMTSKKHKSGTDRCAEAILKVEEAEGKEFDVVINIQGDEPFIKTEQLTEIKKCFNKKRTQIATLVKPINNKDDIFNPNKPKVVIFDLISEYRPTGDQPEAIRQLTNGLLNGQKHQTLLGVTGSGKTFTIANVIKNVGCPVLVLSHNKTLAAQLYSEFKSFFPRNAVEYFVSYYDYYQPEAYLPTTDTYIEKDLAINDEIEKLRLSATSALLSGRKDVIVVCSVSCIYGIGNPEDFHANILKVGNRYDKNL